jgi:methylenetetrahydrofolate reductase (NADPH)
MKMANETSELQARIDSGKRILVAELSPPKNGNGDHVRERARLYAEKVHALGVSDNRDGAAMSALAAASLAQQEGVEAILHVVTRDRNRMALVSECLGAQALGIRNILCTTGTHQTLGPARSAKSVFDIDSIQLLQAYANLANDASLVGEACYAGAGPYCLGAAISQHADPVEMQMMRLAKKVEAGARFVITQPVFDIERFDAFWHEVVNHGLHEKVAVLAGVSPLTDAHAAEAYAAARPSPKIPTAVLQRLSAKPDPSQQQTEGVAIAVETIEHLSAIAGLRGFAIRSDGSDEAVLAVLGQAGLGVD